LEVCLVDF